MEDILSNVLKLINDAMGYVRVFVIGATAFPSFTVITKIIFTNIDKFNVFLNLLHFLLVVLSGM